MKNQSDGAQFDGIPQGWEVVALSDDDFCKVIMGQSPPSECYNKDGNGIPFIQGNAEFGERHPNPVMFTTESPKIAQEKDVLISVRAPVGDVNIADKTMCIGRGVAAIRFNADNHLFYFYLFQFIRKTLDDMSGGSTFKAVTIGDLKRLNVLRPPINEQRKIAEILGTVDEAIQKTDAALAKTERLKKGLMNHLLTRGIGHANFKDSELGKIPLDWDIVVLSELIREIQNGFASGKRDENGIVQLRMNNVTIDGRIIWDSFLKVPIPGSIERYLLKRGDFLFNNTNSAELVGKSSVFRDAPFDCTFSNHFTRIRFKNDRVVPEIILYNFIELWSRNYFKSVCIRHVGQAAVSTSELVKIRLMVPPIPEQRKIAEILSTVDKKLDLERERKQKLQVVKRGLMSFLLTGKKRVNISGEKL